MKFIFTLLSVLFVPILSLKEIKPKLCINCKYFIEDYDYGKFGKFNQCSMFPKEKVNNVYALIHGVETFNGYLYCSTTRETESLCGNEGKMYKRKYYKRKIE